MCNLLHHATVVTTQEDQTSKRITDAHQSTESKLMNLHHIRPTAHFDSEDQARRYGELMEQAEALASDEIHKLFARGFSGETVKLPDAYLSRDDVWVRTEYQSFAVAAQEASDNEQAFRVLLLACKARKAGQDVGPLLDRFMSTCADVYAEEHAGDIAKAARDAEEAEAKEFRP